MTLDEALEAVRFCNSYSRLPAIIDCHDCGLSQRDTLVLLGECWSICDNVSSYAEDLDEILPARTSPDMMTDGERTALAALPARVTVYRGADARVNERGFCWSLDRTIAERFPFLNRYRASNPVLVTAVVARPRIIALKLCRNEAEVIARPFGVRVRSVQPIDRALDWLGTDWQGTA